MIIYKGTFGVPFAWKLCQPDGKTPYNLEGKTVTFRLWRQTDPNELLINGKCVITDAEEGKVEYLIKKGEFDKHGEYWAQFVAFEEDVDNVPFTPFLIQVRNTAVPQEGA